MPETIQLDPSARVRFMPVHIPAGSALSDPIDLLGYVPKGIEVPAGFQGTTVSLQAAQVLTPDPTIHAQYPYQDVFTSGGGQVTMTVAASTYVTFTSADQEQLSGVRFMRLRAGTTGAPQVQAADRNFFLVVAVSME